MYNIFNMSFNLEQSGFPIALIKNNKNDKIVYLDDKNDAHTNYSELILEEGKGKIQYIFNTKRERFIAYVSGQSGSGKSYWTQQIANEYRKIYPKREIYLFSYVNDDDSIDAIKGLKRLDIQGEDFLNMELSAEDFKDSLVIFDDCDCIRQKTLKNKIKDILDKILMTGRHFNTSCIYLSHLTTAGGDTKMILAETHSITVFPNTLNGRTRDYLYKSYIGLNKKQIENLKKLEDNTRSLTFVKSYPSCFISDHEIILTKNL
jgi:hypothetical protein